MSIRKILRKYRKKPVIIKASQWFMNGDHPEDNSVLIQDYADQVFCSEGQVVRRFRRSDVPGDKICNQCGNMIDRHGWIDTPEGGHRVCPGDWIITGVKGERYPCKPDIFNKTYELVEDE